MANRETDDTATLVGYLIAAVIKFGAWGILLWAAIKVVFFL